MLTTPVKQLKKIWKKEKPQSMHINIIGHYDDTTLIDKDGKLIKLFKIEGIDAVTQESLQLDIAKNRCNSLWKSFSSEYAVYSWTIRSKTAEYPAGEFSAPFADALNKSYQTKIAHKSLFNNRLYLAIVTKPAHGYINNSLNWFKRFSHKWDNQARAEHLHALHVGLTQASQRIESALQAYDIKPLGVIERQGKQFSQALELMSELLNNHRYPIPLIEADASHLLSFARSFFQHRSGTIELRYPNGRKRYGAVIGIKEYAGFSMAGMLDELSKLRLEFVITQSYRFYDRQTSKSLLADQRADMEQTQDAAITQTEELTDALDETASGETGLGEHHFSIICWCDKLAELEQAVADLIAALGRRDIISVREELLSECAFWAQLPGNFAYIPRPSPISTKNFAGFTSFHNASQGKIAGNYWGDAVTVLETLSGSPYYFNFHFRDVGNTLIFGSMGAGKTVLMGFLLSQSMKFGGKRIVFDKDRGLEILVRALGGNYEILKPGTPTGFNPCLLPDTVDNRSFLAALFKKILTTHLTAWDEHDSETVEKVIERLYTLPLEDRRFRHIAAYFGTKTKNSLRARFDEWHSEGNKAWLFDNEQDNLDLRADVLGFELGAILKNADAKTPACMYLMHRINQALEGQRGGIFADEGWNMLDDDYFKKELEDWGRTPRKKNRFLCLATQSADDAVKSSVSEVLSQSAVCKLFFPNPAAKRSTYINALGLSEREFELIKTLEDDKRFFLLNYGKGKESLVVRADLSGLDDSLAVISGREISVLILDTIRKELGSDPAVWLPIFTAMVNCLDDIRKAVGDTPSSWLPYFLENREALCLSKD